jgi:hypothetical protein
MKVGKNVVEIKGKCKNGAVGKNVVASDGVCGPTVAVSGGWGWLCSGEV